jgi:hypothetical protein
MDRQGKPELVALSLERLLARSWPGGADRSVPAARIWLRAWGPVRAGARLLPSCGCAGGHCGVCN